MIPTNGEVIREILSVEERERFEKHLPPIAERGGKRWRTPFLHLGGQSADSARALAVG